MRESGIALPPERFDAIVTAILPFAAVLERRYALQFPRSSLLFA